MVWFTEVTLSNLSQYITLDPEDYPDPTFNDYLLAFIGKISAQGDRGGNAFLDNLFRGGHGKAFADGSLKPTAELTWVNTKFTVRFIANYVEADDPESTRAWTGSIADNYLEYQIALVRDKSWYFSDGNNKIRIFVKVLPKRFK